MTTPARFFLAAICVATCSSAAAFAQTAGGRQRDVELQSSAPAATSDPVANEIGLLRRSLQTLNTRLREISERLVAADAKSGGTADENQKRIALSLDLLSRAEQRAEALRKQLLELIEKETLFKTRLANLEDDMRPDSIDRSIALVGSTRTPELREVRRRVLENERRGVESVLAQTSSVRVRLEDDVKEADLLVFKIRQRVLPIIEKEIDKISPVQP
jgi:hypothetical protein